MSMSRLPTKMNRICPKCKRPMMCRIRFVGATVEECYECLFCGEIVGKNITGIYGKETKTAREGKT